MPQKIINLTMVNADIAKKKQTEHSESPPDRTGRCATFHYIIGIKKGMLKKKRKLLKHPGPEMKPKFTVREVIKIVYGHDIDLCRSCMKGALLVVEKWTKDRASPPQMAGIDVAV